MQVYNRTEFTEEQISSLELIHSYDDYWRLRSIGIFKHPIKKDMVITCGVRFDLTEKIIAEEEYTAFKRIIENKILVVN